MKNITCFIIYSKIQNIWDNDYFNAQIIKLSDFDQKKIRSYQSPKDQQLRIMTRLLLNCYLKSINGNTISIKDIHYKNNKPFLNDPISFSFSHANDIAVCAISTESIIGIDIELNKAVNQILFQEYLSLAEQKVLQESKNKSAVFLEFWTKKEAILKASGMGLTKIELNQLSVIKEPIIFENNYYYTKNILIGDYVTCLASTKPIQEFILNEVFF